MKSSNLLIHHAFHLYSQMIYRRGKQIWYLWIEQFYVITLVLVCWYVAASLIQRLLQVHLKRNTILNKANPTIAQLHLSFQNINKNDDKKWQNDSFKINIKSVLLAEGSITLSWVWGSDCIGSAVDLPSDSWDANL